MPCNSDHLNATDREVELQRAARLLVYVKERLGEKPEKWMIEQANKSWADDERSVIELCAALNAMTKKQRDTIIYNARDKVARDLADWWEEHQKVDTERARRDVALCERDELRKKALKKLTRAERKALGLE